MCTYFVGMYEIVFENEPSSKKKHQRLTVPEAIVNILPISSTKSSKEGREAGESIQQSRIIKYLFIQKKI